MKLKKKKLLIIVCLIFIMMTSTVVLADNEPRLGVSQAINLVLEQNTDLHIAKLRLDNAKIKYQKREANNLATQSRHSEMEAKLNLIQAENEYYETQTQLIKEVLTKYSEVILAKKDVEVKRKKKELEKFKLDKIEAQIESGHKNDLDLIKQMNEYQEAEFNLEQARDNYQKALQELKLTINQNGKTNLELETLENPQIWSITEEEVLKTGFANNTKLKIEEEKIKLMQQELNKARQKSTPSLELKKLRNNFKIAELEKESLKKELKTSLYAGYYDLRQAVNNFNLRAKNLGEVKANYDRIKRKAEKGLAAKKELMAAKVQLLQAQYEYQSAIVSYYSKQLELQTDMKLEMEGLIDGLTQE